MATYLSVDAGVLGEMVSEKNQEALKELGGVQGLSDKLGTSLKNGIEGRDLNARISRFGKNDLPEHQSVTFLGLLLEGLQDRTLVMLMISAAVSLALGIHENPKSGWIEGFAIILAVTIVVLVTATNDYQKEQQFRALNSKKEDRGVKVVRRGELQEISVFDLVVGDILSVEAGDILPADGVYVSGHGLKCDESSATGESDSVAKPEADPFFLSGTQILEGNGRILVLAVGPNSFHGRTLLALREETEDTPLQKKLDAMADRIGKIGLLAAILTLMLLTFKDLVWNPLPFEYGTFFSHLITTVITSITMLVVAVPEGLPLAVTISLAYSMKKMLRDNNLVRHLAACETMGGATAICSDKTGTLTQNRMTVVRGRVAQTHFDSVDGLKDQLSEPVLQLLFEGVALNTTAFEGTTQQGTLEFLGNKTESALLSLTKKMGSDYRDLRESMKIVDLIPFTSDRKSMVTVVSLGSKRGYRCHVKGASELILSLCTYQISERGEKIPFPENDRRELELLIETMAENALRTICLAYCESPSVPEEGWRSFTSRELILLALVGIEDPLREEAADAVRACQRAGVVVRMVTGDNLATAKNIARHCSILTDDLDQISMEGPEFRSLSDHEMGKIIPKLRVLARSSPLDKKILVGKLKEMGEIVAVTGDGTNDSPALKLAHVGFSMGIAGTEVAKEASDIILMDDNFTSIVKAMLWGRNVFDSIRKFLQFQLTVNIAAVALAFFGALTSGRGESPLKPVQLLWVNLIMDTMAALALATEEPTSELLDRPPQSREGSALITRTMWKNIIGQSIFQLLLNFGLLQFLPRYYGIEPDSTKHLTIFFNTFVMCQLFNETNSRKIHDELNVFKGFFRNKTFLFIMLFTVVVQFIIVEYGGRLTSTTPLTFQEWSLCIGIGALSLPVGFILKLIPVETHHHKKKQRSALLLGALDEASQNSVMDIFLQEKVSHQESKVNKPLKRKLSNHTKEE